MSITNKLNQIKNAIYGKEVRGAIHDAIKQAYDDATVNHDNANMEVKMARGTHNTLNDRLNKTDEIQAQTNAQLSKVEQFVTPEQFGGVGDGITDDTSAVTECMNYARLNKSCVLLTNKYYVTQTIDVTDVYIKGHQKASAQLIPYTSKRLGYLGYKFWGDVDEGATVTFAEMVEEAITGSCIISDTANPVLKTTNGLNLENFGVFGWKKTKGQIGVQYLGDTTTISYIPGIFYFKNFNVSGFDGDGVKIPSLEVKEIDYCEFSQNNGNGLNIEGYAGKDTPFEYVTFNNCHFKLNRLNGLYSNHYRKSVEFNNCQFTDNGQYDLVNYSQDGYDRTVPSSQYDICSGVRIEGIAEMYSYNRQGRNLSFINCYGERCEKLLHLENSNANGSKAFRGLKINNCHVLKRNATNSLFADVRLDYLYDVDITSNQSDSDYKFVNHVKEISIINMQSDFYNELNNDLKISLEKDKFISNYGWYEVIDQCNAETTVPTTVIKDMISTYYPSINESYRYILFVLAINSQTRGTDSTHADLFMATRDNNGRYKLLRMTNNAANLSASIATDGTLNVTIPAWHACSLQRIDTTYFKNS